MILLLVFLIFVSDLYDTNIGSLCDIFNIVYEHKAYWKPHQIQITTAFTPLNTLMMFVFHLYHGPNFCVNINAKITTHILKM